MHERTGIRRLYREMSRETARDPSFRSEREHALDILLSARIQRDEIEEHRRERAQRKHKRNAAAAARKKKESAATAEQKGDPPPPCPKMASAMSAYKKSTPPRRTRQPKSKGSRARK